MGGPTPPYPAPSSGGLNQQTVTDATGFTPANDTQALVAALAFNGTGLAQKLESIFIVDCPVVGVGATGYGITFQLRSGAVILATCTAAYNVNGGLHGAFVARTITVGLELNFYTGGVSGWGEVSSADPGLQTATGILGANANFPFQSFANSLATPAGNFNLSIYAADATTGVTAHCHYAGSRHILTRES